MIVFTITNAETGKVYVASSRNAPESRWAQLVSQANNGQEGKLYNEIRYHGDDCFTVEEWGYADEPSEIRQLMKEAQQDLGAEPLNIGKSDAEVASKRKKLSDRDAKRLLEELERTVDAMSSGDDDVELPQKRFSAQPDVEDEPSKAISSATVTRTSGPTIISRKTLSISGRATSSASPAPSAPAEDVLPTGRVGSRAKEQQIREKIENERMTRDMNKSAQIARDAAQMNQVIASIEWRRKSMREEAAAKRLATRRAEQKSERAAKAMMERQRKEKLGLLDDSPSYSEPTPRARASVTSLHQATEITKAAPEKPKEPLAVREKRIRDQILLQRTQLQIRQRSQSAAQR